jgi:uncharacterized protein YPO0396
VSAPFELLPPQWRAERMQLVNWGGFEGRNIFDFHQDSNLISGASGTGKSTLLDAYLALMMPPNTAFNGASNEAGGRARSGEQRSLLSYLRGQVDTTADPEDGTKIAKLLRGRGTNTWGAVAMTFVNDSGQRFTAMRIYFVPALATSDSGIKTRLVTLDTRIDLAELEQHVPSKFAPAALKAVYPTLREHGSYQAYATVLHSRLGIDANGDGSKAMQLLIRVQSGQSIRTVDELYKSLVLDKPETFESADAAIKEFDNLEESYVSMRAAQEKAELLSPITGYYEQLTAARAELADLDTFGLTRPGVTPLSLWSLRKQSDLLAAAMSTNMIARKTTGESLRAAESNLRASEAEHATAVEAHREAGGGQLERLGVDIETERSAASARQERLDRLRTQIAILDDKLADRESFERLASDAHTFLGDHLPAAKGRIRAELRTVSEARYPLLDRQRFLRAELASLDGRQGRIPGRLNRLRVQAAEALGVQPRDLPFLGELIDVLPEHTDWRTAIETVLGAEATVMLVPAEQLSSLSAALDPLQMDGRLRFHGAATGLAVAPDLSDPTRIAGKLAYKDSPFAGWVAQQVASPAFNAVCVEHPQDLDGKNYRVTSAGQTRRGRRGAHGQDRNRQSVIGFSNDDLIAEMNEELYDLGQSIAELDRRTTALEEALDHLDDKRRAYDALDGARWDDFDVESSLARIATLEKTRDDILAADNKLSELSELVNTLAASVKQARRVQFEMESRRDALNAEHASLVDQEDLNHTDLFAIEDAGDVTLDPAHATKLDAVFVEAAAPKDPNVLADFPHTFRRMVAALERNQEQAQTSLERAIRDLESVFRAYEARWHDPNLTQSFTAYEDHAAILKSILDEGLHDLHDDWRRKVADWSGQSLVPLNGAMEQAIAEIQDRLDPINDILSALDFGANGDRLSIKLRIKQLEKVTAFRKQLKDLSGGATGIPTEEHLEKLFVRIQSFMALLRGANDPRKTDASNRDALLDVRQHVEVTADRHDTDGKHLSTYDGLGGKSGGESQELAAFIVGAALLFRLGSQKPKWPRFAPVFLDEGFVKSDSEFAGRAVRAWQELGFQLIVGAPLDKVTSLEPHMSQILGITKDPSSHRSFVISLKDANAGAGQ